MNLIALKNEASGLGAERPLETPALNRLAEIQVPTLIIVGDRDRPEIIEAADLLERRSPRARRVAIPGTAHPYEHEETARIKSGRAGVSGGLEV